MGLDVYLTYKGKDVPETHSTQFPEHYFKLNYFRSSYNDGGLNSFLLTRYGNEGLYHIFNEPDTVKHARKRYIPDWKGALVRAKEVLALMENDPIPNIMVRFEGMYQLFRENEEQPKEQSPNEIVQAFLQEYMLDFSRTSVDPLDKHSYSNSKGLFLFGGEQEQLLSIMFGKKYTLPGVYLFTQGKTNTLTWYEQAVKIVIESIEYVLSTKEEKKYGLIWSS